MYRWVAEGLDDATVATLGGADFDSQERAEDWLSASYEDLSDAGATGVSLYEEDRLVYGPMGLSTS